MTVAMVAASPSIAFATQTGAGMTDPRRMQQWVHAASQVATASTLAAPSTLSTASTFFSLVGAWGANVDSNWTASTYKTLVSVAGPTIAILGNVIGPTATQAMTTTLRITRDGTQFTIPVTNAISQRAVYGPYLPDSLYTTSDTNLFNFGSYDTNRTFVQLSSQVQMNIQAPYLQEYFQPWDMVSCESSLTVEMQTSVNLTATTNMERQCAVTYIKKY